MSAPVPPQDQSDPNLEPQHQIPSDIPVAPQGQPIQPTNQSDPFLMLSLNQERERSQRLEAELAQMRNVQNQRPTDYNTLNQQFLERPVDIIDQRVARQLQESVAPLQQFVLEQRQMQQYTILKNQVRMSIPDFAILEPYVDQIMSGAVPNGQTLNAAILMARGLLVQNNAYQQPQQPQQPQYQQPQTPGNVVPAQLPPSAPRLPNANPNQRNQRRALSELEKRLAHENRMTPTSILIISKWVFLML
jgi:hypothetical protein